MRFKVLPPSLIPVLLAFPALASASDAQIEAQVSVRTGLDHYRAERYEEAVRAFRRAEVVIQGDPSLTWNIARCYEELGDIANAVHYFELFVKRHPDDSAAPESEKKLEKLRPRLPGKLTVRCGDERSATIRIDGQARGACERTIGAIEPGEHDVEAISPRRGTWSGRVRVEPREKVEVAVDWSAAVVRSATPRAPTAAPQVAPVEGADPPARTWASWALTGAAVVGALVVGAGAVLAIVQPGRVEVPSTALGRRTVLQE